MRCVNNLRTDTRVFSPLSYIFSVSVNKPISGPTLDALEALDHLVVNRSPFWAMAVGDMAFKLLISSLLGVIFQDSQVAGACVSWLVCASIMAFFAFARPYSYPAGNLLSVMSYGSLLAEFTQTVSSKLALEVREMNE